MVCGTSSVGLWVSCILGYFGDFMSLSRYLDFYGHTFYSYMIDIVFLDSFVKYSVIQFYLKPLIAWDMQITL